MNGWTARDIPDQTGRVAVITGASSGLGYESAVALARKGARVVMACRNLEKAERARQGLLKRAPGAAVEVLRLDLGDLSSVRSFAETFNHQYDRLDILMNNAGIMFPPTRKTVDGFESTFGTNHLGHFALTGLLLPKLLQTPASRVVTVTSGVYLAGRIDFNDLQNEQNYWPLAAYCQSKLANMLFSQELRRKLEAVGADVISVVCHPGYAITHLQGNQIGFLQQVMGPILNRTVSQSAELGATYQLYAATAPNVLDGEFYGPRLLLRGKVVRVELNAQAKDAVLAARLWQASEQLTGVHYESFEDHRLVA